MNLDASQISTIIGTAVTLFGAVWRTIGAANTALKKMIKAEVLSLSEKLDSLEENQKSLDSRVSNIVSALKEYKTYSAQNRASMSEIQSEIKHAIEKNTEVLQEVTKSQVEWLTKEVMLIKGKKP